MAVEVLVMETMVDNNNHNPQLRPREAKMTRYSVCRLDAKHTQSAFGILMQVNGYFSTYDCIFRKSKALKAKMIRVAIDIVRLLPGVCILET